MRNEIYAGSLVLAIALFGCDKDQPEPNSPPQPQPANTQATAPPAATASATAVASTDVPKGGMWVLEVPRIPKVVVQNGGQLEYDPMLPPEKLHLHPPIPVNMVEVVEGPVTKVPLADYSTAIMLDNSKMEDVEVGKPISVKLKIVGRELAVTLVPKSG